MKRKKTKKIYATDISRWCYCPRQWWYFETTGRKPKATTEMQAGLQHHFDEGRKVSAVRKAQTQFTSTIVIGGFTCLVLFLLWLSS